MKQMNTGSKNKPLTKEELENKIRALEGELKLSAKKIENLEHELKYAQHFKGVAEHDLNKCIKSITLALEILSIEDNNSVADAILSLSLAPIHQKGEGIH
jgi:predicted RNase H-like nuclease (RuvC/YqgF family)